MTESNQNFNFGYLKQIDVKEDTTAEFPIVDLTNDEYEPRLIVTCSRTCKPLLEQSAKDAVKNRGRRKTAQANINFDRIRKEDREIFIEHIIKDWKEVYDGTGNPVTFTKAACSNFINALPDYIFDELRGFCLNPANFAGDIELEEVKQDLVKNSASGTSSK